MALEAKLEVEILREKSGSLGFLIYSMVSGLGRELNFKDGSEKLTDDSEWLGRILKNMKKNKLYVEFARCKGSSMGNYAIYADLKVPGYLWSHTHFNFNGSWEGADKELKKQIAVLQEFGFKFDYQGYNKYKSEKKQI